MRKKFKKSDSFDFDAEGDEEEEEEENVEEESGERAGFPKAGANSAYSGTWERWNFSFSKESMNSNTFSFNAEYLRTAF